MPQVLIAEAQVKISCSRFSSYCAIIYSGIRLFRTHITEYNYNRYCIFGCFADVISVQSVTLRTSKVYVKFKHLFSYLVVIVVRFI